MNKKSKKSLFDENAEDDAEIKLNNDYASKYEQWRRKEELNKSKARYGDILDEDNEDSSSSSDDENFDDVNVIDTNFLQTLSCLKNKDPRIYDKNVKFFNYETENNDTDTKDTNKKEKPMYIRDYERKLLLENGGNVESDDEFISENPRASSPTYVEEQRQLKENLKKVLNEDDDNENNEWGGMFKKREKNAAELAREEEDYVKWLKGQTDSVKDENIVEELKPLKSYWNNPNLDKEEQFLRDYILNKKFLEDEETDHIPSYEEIVHDSDNGFSDDGETIRVQEEFETKYNYRFEEPDQEFIKRYPRTMENSVRKKDDRRKQKRAEIRERKEEEKLRKKEELSRLKALKRKEIEEKIEKLKQITGNDQVGFNDNDIEGDFDPDEHDQRMQQLFNEEFYQCKEGDQKPEFPELDEELEIENWDKWDGNNDNYEPHCEDEDFNMDCDYDPLSNTQKHQDEMIENSKNKRKRRRRSKFAQVLSTSKPKFNPNDKTYEEYLDEYYKLDYEDLIGDLPCRFKYRKVVPNDFGLSIEEILAAKDKELNRWCSLKKAIQIRPENVEKYDVLAYKKKAQNENLKKKVFNSLYLTEDNEDNNPQPSTSSENLNNEQPINANEKKFKNKKKRKISEMEENHIPDKEINNQKKRKLNRTSIKSNNSKKKHQNLNNKSDINCEYTDERLKAYGLNPKKFKNKLKYKQPLK